jgi:hypothetical protein
MVIAPTPASDGLVIRNVQACCSFDTFADEIIEAGACRVLARSPFGNGHEPDGGAAFGFVVVADCVLDVQAAARRATGTASRLIPMRVRRVRHEAGMTPLP